MASTKFVASACLLFLVAGVSLAALPLPDNYDASTRPNQGSVADVINVAAELHSIRRVEESTSEMTVDISIHTSWVDSRLFGIVTRDTFFMDKQIPHIWLPNVQIGNAASSPSAGVMQVLQLSRDGQIKLIEKRTAKITCAISQIKYPFDRQLCRLQIHSFGYSSLHLKLLWDGTISFDVATYHPEFSFSHAEQTSENYKIPNGVEYSHLYLEIGVSRCPLRVIFRAMIPSILLVILSYCVSFCHCPFAKGSKKASSMEIESATVNGTHGHHHHQVDPLTSTVIAQPIPTTSNNSHSPEPMYLPDPFMPISSPSFNLLLVAINGMIFILTMIIAQINFMESPRSSAVSGLDVWLNFMSAVIFIILWHSVQLYFSVYSSQLHQRSSKNGGDSSCCVSRATNFLKLGIPAVVAVFLVIYFGVYLS